MPKRTSKPKDENITAFEIMKAATEDQEEPAKEETHQKNPAAVALGRLGGLKGGNARAKKLSAKKRKEIASKAAKSRWANKNRM